MNEVEILLGLVNKAIGGNQLDEAMFLRMGIRHELRSNDALLELKTVLEQKTEKQDVCSNDRN